MPDEIFISYSRRDLSFVTNLHQDLIRRGFSAWFDQTDIAPGDQWREAIVKGIMECKLFLLALSPDSVASKNVRKEIDLAERHGKPIVPVMWRQTDFPPAIQYQLAGVQYLDFKETESTENFDKLARVLKKLLAGASMAEAARGAPVVESQAGPAAVRQAPPAGGRRANRLGGGRLQQKAGPGPAATGGMVIARVVTPLALDIEAQDIVNAELQWLFTAAEHFLAVRRGDKPAAGPVPVAIPPGAECRSGANNTLPAGDDFSLQLAEGQVKSIIKQINIYLRNLTFELDKEAMLGGAAAANVALMNSIRAQRRSIIERAQELAQVIKQLYGVMVYSPEELAGLLN